MRSLRHILRLLRIAIVLERHDALFFLRAVPPLKGLAWLARAGARMLPLRARVADGARPGERLTLALQALGPSFIKLGQMLSTRSDLLGEELAADLSLLQDHLAPFPGRQARQIIAAELGAPVEIVFATFDDTPLAAASIAQVHLATIDDGSAVAVKVLRPGIEEAFLRDLDLFRWIAEWAERVYPPCRRLRPLASVETLAEMAAVEMDLRLEATAASELAQNFAGDPWFHVPAVNWQRSSARVLTCEWISGIPIDERDQLVAAGINPDLVLERSADAFFKQVFRDGFFHGDLHPGNLFVEPDGRLAVVDFGIMGRLDRRTRFYLAEMLLGFLNRDYEEVARVQLQAGYISRDINRGAFIQACRAVGEPILEKPLHEISIARLLGQMFAVTARFNMPAQPQLLLLQKNLLLAEGVGRLLNPRANLWKVSRPLIESWRRRYRGPQARLRQGADDLLATAERLPQLLRHMEEAAKNLAGEGVRLHPDSLRALKTARRREGAGPLALGLLWLAVAGLTAAVVVLALGP